MDTGMNKETSIMELISLAQQEAHALQVALEDLFNPQLAKESDKIAPCPLGYLLTEMKQGLNDLRNSLVVSARLVNDTRKILKGE